jgi:hypothetical protein
MSSKKIKKNLEVWYNMRMMKLKYYENNLNFLIRLFFVLIGLITLIIGGSISIVLINHQSLIFAWLGGIISLAMGVVAYKTYRSIQKNLKEIKKL